MAFKQTSHCSCSARASSGLRFRRGICEPSSLSLRHHDLGCFNKRGGLPRPRLTVASASDEDGEAAAVTAVDSITAAEADLTGLLLV